MGARGQVWIRHRTSNPENEGSNPPGSATPISHSFYKSINRGTSVSEDMQKTSGSGVKVLILLVIVALGVSFSIYQDSKLRDFENISELNTFLESLEAHQVCRLALSCGYSSSLLMNMGNSQGYRIHRYVNGTEGVSFCLVYIVSEKLHVQINPDNLSYLVSSEIIV